MLRWRLPGRWWHMGDLSFAAVCPFVVLVGYFTARLVYDVSYTSWLQYCNGTLCAEVSCMLTTGVIYVCCFLVAYWYMYMERDLSLRAARST